MITADDPRHGLNSGYIAGCREVCCRTGHATYRRWLRDRHYLAGGLLEIDATGTIRRIQALAVMGHSLEQVSRQLGHCKSWASHLMRVQAQVHRRTARDVANLYDQLCMQQGPGVRARRVALARGWHGPLAWDDDTIDDPEAKPWRPRVRDRDALVVDEVLVQRALTGVRVTANHREKRLITTRWQAAGRSLTELQRAQGWDVHRLLREAS